MKTIFWKEAIMINRDFMTIINHPTSTTKSSTKCFTQYDKASSKQCWGDQPRSTDNQNQSKPNIQLIHQLIHQHRHESRAPGERQDRLVTMTPTPAPAGAAPSPAVVPWRLRPSVGTWLRHRGSSRDEAVAERVDDH